ncbi:ubiquinone-binding protein [Ahniella affigens]|uniref:Ubiquinone-binding protein n=1 Tax=Ahniella affigens TaxID=2021234 RepID=A0A2P1PMC2_9GAMM|nr:type II toxin-antitoxin system RatA family toxin [Ahniella affigens]AVP95994.1 ubiquinone-binding protein [Ahniella affigens]
MSRIERSALIAQPAGRMFTLVNEVEDYPRLFTWCQAARIESRSDTQMRARLDLSYLGFRAGFSTENELVPGESITLNLLEGPFKSLRGRWQFLALGDVGCKVTLNLDFEFAGSLMGSALALGFQGLADRLVDDFSRAARNLPKAA